MFNHVLIGSAKATVAQLCFAEASRLALTLWFCRGIFARFSLAGYSDFKHSRL